MGRYYLGLATTFHDSASALVGPDGEILFAEATERYLQYKRAWNCPPDSTLRLGELLLAHVPHDAELVVATSWDDRITSHLARSASVGRFEPERLALRSAKYGNGLSSTSWGAGFFAALHVQQQAAGVGVVLAAERAFGTARIAAFRRYRHHLCHAALGAFGSPFDEAACLVVDGMGESGAVSLFAYGGAELREVRASFGNVSPGFFFALLTDLCGFDSFAGEEWKLMGLAPYGRPDAKLAEQVRRLYFVDGEGRPRRVGSSVVDEVADALRDLRPVVGDDAEHGWADLAYVAQEAFCEIMDLFVRQAWHVLPHAHLVLAGGCALNSSYSGTIVGRHGYDDLHVPSAPADDGNALGAALLAWSQDHPGRRPEVGPRPISPYVGSTVATEPLSRMHAHEPRVRLVGDDVVERTARLLADGKLVGWVQGRAEFGPRALGNRSILADPRSAGTKDRVNALVKHREPFRPFAPAILADRAPEWFSGPAQASPYMERTLRWRAEKRPLVPAVVHVDGTGRLQTVTRGANPRFHALLAEFERLTSVPVLLNTSLNVMGKPIVHTTEDALAMFYTTGLDALVVGDWMVEK
jgi:carbamoyltransferase